MNLPNYHVCLRFCEAFNKALDLNVEVHIKEGLTSKFGDSSYNDGISRLSSYNANLEKARIFKINNDIATLFSLTNNQPLLDDRLPYPIIFLECKIPVHGKYLANETSVSEGSLSYLGVLLIEVPTKNITYNEEKDEQKWVWPSFDEAANATKVKIYLYALCKNPRYRFEYDYHLTEGWLTEKGIADWDFLDLEEKRQIDSFIANFLDFIHDPEVEVIQYRFSSRQKEIRKRKGKYSPPTDIVRINGRLLQYVNRLRTGKHFTYSHKFWVRGHWRRLQSQKFTHKRGQRIWIKPHVKGQGILISEKTYYVKESQISEVNKT